MYTPLRRFRTNINRVECRDLTVNEAIVIAQGTNINRVECRALSSLRVMTFSWY